MRDITGDLHRLSTSGSLPPADQRAKRPADAAAEPRKMARDAFTLTLLAAVAAAIVGQIALILWVDQL